MCEIFHVVLIMPLTCTIVLVIICLKNKMNLMEMNKLKTKKYELDMTKGSILKSILRFSIPYMLTSMLQIFYNAADLVVVSRWTGSEAMASVGATSAITNLLLNLFLGMSVGTSVIMSRRYGAHDKAGMEKAVHTTVLLAIILGITSLIIGQAFCKPLLILMDTPEGTVLNGAVLYMRIIFLGTPATLCYNFCSAILRSVGDTKRPLYILSLSGIVNVLLNLLFVILFNMGVAGVGLATIISKYISAIAVVAILLKTDSEYKLYVRKLKIHKNELLSMLKIGIPAGLQNTVLSFSNTIIQSALNSFGAAAMAGASAASNIENFAFSVKDSFRQATVTAISQNYGAKDEKRMNRCFYTCLLCMVVGGFCLSVLMTVFSKSLISIYITDSPKAMEYGMMRMVVTGAPYFLSGIMDIYTGYLRGLGHANEAMVNSFIGVCGFRLIWVFLIFPLNRTFAMLYLCWPLSWILVAVMNMVTLHFVKKKIGLGQTAVKKGM